jgi:hypothetical protein
MRTYTASGRSRWPFIIGGAALIVVIALAVVYGLSQNTPHTTAAPMTAAATPSVTPTTTTQPTSSAADGDSGTAPSGCLGGPKRGVGMVLKAQKLAAHTTFGAVDAAAAFARWSFQYPYPAASDSSSMSKVIVASDASADQKDLAGQYAAAGDLTSGTVPAGTPFYLSTVSGLWTVSEGSTSDRVTVNLNTNYVVDGTFSPTKTAAIAYVMVWQDGAWKVESAMRPDTQQLASGGTLFTGGC